MKQLFLIAFCILFVISSLSLAASKGSGRKYSSPFEKQQNIDKSRWTLAEWMAQKDKMKWQDMWLAMNTSANDFEFFLGGDSAAYKSRSPNSPEDLPSYRVNRLLFAAYATIIGLEWQSYEAKDTDTRGWNGIFNFRILGRSIQGTNLTLQYGLRNRTTPFNVTAQQTFQNQFAGASLTLYLTKYFGIEGAYQKLLKEKSDKDVFLQGSRSEAGAFIDFNFFRVYGQWFREPLIYTNTDLTESEIAEQGIAVGAKFYF